MSSFSCMILVLFATSLGLRFPQTLMASLFPKRSIFRILLAFLRLLWSSRSTSVLLTIILRLFFTCYHHRVGSLVYLDVTHPDISYPVHTLSQFVSAPTSIHFSHHICVLRYVHGTLIVSFFPCSSSSIPSYLLCFFLVVFSLPGSS